VRDILVTAIVFGSLLFILHKPYIGILVWSWLSYMNPHRLTWGFAYNMPFAQIVAITLLTAVLFSKERKSIPLTGTTVLWVVFLLWMTVSTIFAIHYDAASIGYIKIIKIQLVTFLTMMLITTPARVTQIIWVVVMSIGFFSIKGGVFTILTGGSYRVWGPPSSFIEENNALALSVMMILPLMYYLYTISDKKWLRYFLIFSIVCSIASAVGSQSRGALIAILAVGGFFWLKSSRKVATGIMVIAISLVGFAFMPDSWHERMSTIQNYEEDASAMGRINAWTYSINIANDRLTGGGLNSWSASTFAVYAPDPLNVFVAHSIYFSVLADHGWPGLILFLLILMLTWRSLSKIIKQTKNDEKALQVNTLARMVQISLIAYLSGGAFLSLSYFDLPWFLIALTQILKRQLNEEQGQLGISKNSGAHLQGETHASPHN